jgi:cell division protein FtsZ
VAVVTTPFGFEVTRRMRLAEEGLAKLAATVDTVIAIPNDRLLALVPKGASFFDAFKVADDLLRQAVEGISDIIITPGLINRDFSDIKATMVGMGYAMMGTATAKGENAAVEAARKAINCPLLEDSRISGSRGILINITGSNQLGLHEVNEACSIIREAAECEDVQINFGVIQNESMGDSVKITVIATGFQPDREPAPEKRPSKAAGPVIRVKTYDSDRPEKPERSAPPLPMVAEPAPAPAPEPEFVMTGAATAAPAAMEHDPPAEQMMLPEPEPEPEPLLDLDDLDTPAYLRQGRMLN